MRASSGGEAVLGTLSVDRVLSALQLEERPPLDLNDPRYWLHGKRAPSLSASPPQASPPPHRFPSRPPACPPGRARVLELQQHARSAADREPKPAAAENAREHKYIFMDKTSRADLVTKSTS